MADGEKVVDSDKVWTVLITNESYLPGLLTLAYSLRRSPNPSAYPLVALYTDTLSPAGHAALDARSIPKQRIEYILPSSSKDYSADPRFYDCWSKLAPFSLTQYSRVVQLDADMLVLPSQTMDELMTLPLDPPSLKGSGSRVFAAGHACVCNPLKKPHYPPDWTPQNCAFTSQHSWGALRASTEAISPSAGGPLGYMNGGLQVVNPCKEIWEQILSYMEKEAVNMDFADQSLLSGLYRDRWVPLPYTYNALKTLRWKGVHDAIWSDHHVKNVHYILAPKPWDEKPEDAKDESHAWWHQLNKERHEEEKKSGIPEDGF
ncbi:hypothetical protein MKZ38_008559 [Zalerion maritima]|uniref:Glycosyltransferase family 8 protein n=1 Tax=Zalerion maritima TaxID=339359 RepID=A0AAD5RU22_9PEZI|nr:hypothetical protein MKZ38_008559 [Zalerion maritima]